MLGSTTSGKDTGEASLLLRRAQVQRRTGRLAEARDTCWQIVNTWPATAEAWHFLGILNDELGNPDAAWQNLNRSLELEPSNARYYTDTGLFLYRRRKFAPSEEAFKKALQLNPNGILALMHLGNLCYFSNRLDQAIELYQRAVALKPDLPVAQCNLGSLLQDEGRLKQALACYNKALQHTSNDGLTIKSALALPVIVASHQELTVIRKRYMDNLVSLRAQRLTVHNPAEIGLPAFYLAYHGLDDRPLQEGLAALYEQCVPGINYLAPHCHDQRLAIQNNKIRIGFISELFRAQTVGIVIAGIINRLNRDTFDVSIFHFPKPGDDEVTDYLKQGSSCWIELPVDLQQARAAIAAKQLDILVFTDIGMTPTTYFLAFSRLAPVQCVTWGHPVTTGIPAMDYYISCEDFESAESDAHYSEQLVRLKNPPTYYHRPRFPDQVLPRSHYGLRDDEHVYLCVQSLFKVHPDFDSIIGDILRQDSQGRMVFVHGSRTHWGELLMERLERTIPDVMPRVSMLTHQSFSNYLNLLRVADVALDTLHFGGGSTAYQSLAAGLPIVTLPGQFMRSRLTYACYRRMNVTNCVASDRDDYVRIAVRLGTDPPKRKQVSQDILAACDALYEDTSAVSEFERFLVSVTTHNQDSRLC